MKITAVVVTYNRLELLKQSIEALRSNKGLTCILVINNGSTDGTQEWLNAQQAVAAEIPLTVIHQENVGGSGGFHTGIKHAYDDGADWIWCMDDDVFPRPDCLGELLRCTESGVGILAPRRIMDGKVFTHEFRRYNFSNPFVSMKQGKIGNQQITAPVDIVGADFEGPFISREVVAKIGLPNKELFIFCDDTDYCLRAHLVGFRLRYVPDAVLDKHKFFADDTWASRNRKKKWKRYYQVRNEAYLNHHYGKTVGVRYLRSFIGVLGYYIPAVMSMPFVKAWSWKDLSVLWQAYRDGISEHLGKRNV